MSDEEKDPKQKPDSGLSPEQAEIERRARAQGWKDRDEFDPSKTDREFVDAETFLKNAEESLPVLKERLYKMSDEVTALRLQQAETKELIQAMKKTHEKNVIAAYERALRDLQARQKEAVRAGDTQEYEQVTEEINKHVENMRDLVAPSPQAVDVYAHDFMGKYRNILLGDPEIMEAAIGFEKGLSRKLSGKALWDQIEVKLSKLYPQYFRKDTKGDGINTEEDPSSVDRRRSVIPALEKGNGDVSRGTSTKAKGYNDLTEEAKATCNMLVRAGIFRDRTEYIAGLPKDDPDVWK